MLAALSSRSSRRAGDARLVYGLRPAPATGIDPLQALGDGRGRGAPAGHLLGFKQGSEIPLRRAGHATSAPCLASAVVTAAAFRRGPAGRPLSAIAVTAFGVLYVPGAC